MRNTNNDILLLAIYDIPYTIYEKLGNKKGRREVSLFVCWGLFTTLLVLVRELV